MITFTVPGTPATKGSYRAVRTKRRTKRGAPLIIVQNDNPRCKSWQEQVGWAAKAAMRGRPPTSNVVCVEVAFTFARPKRTVLAAPALDLDKLLRALFDGMSRIVFVDDRQVVQTIAGKAWGEPGARVTVSAVQPAEALAAIGATSKERG